MHQIRVLHVLNSNSFSGAENVVMTIIRNMPDEITAVYVSPDGPIRAVLEEYNIEFIPLKKVSASEIRRAANDFQADIIHAHDFRAGIAAAQAKTKLPIINHLHNNPPWMRYYGAKSVLYAWAARKFNQILTVSDSVMNEYVFGRRFQDKTTVVGNPIDFSRIEKMGNAETVPDQYDIVFLGRETRQKNPFLFLEIVREVGKQRPRTRAIMIGTGELDDEVAEKIQEYGLKDTVVQAGFKSNPYIYLKSARVLCMPSSWEGFGLAAIEAMYFGLPVVCSGAGGLKGIVDDSCGKICGNTVMAYTDEILQLLAEDSYYNRKSEGAKKRASEYGNLNVYMNQLESVYRSVMEKA